MNTRPSIQRLLAGNAEFVKRKLLEDENIFRQSSTGQQPKYLWIGCSDSRIDPNEITGTGIGDLFVHRNIANLVVEFDLNFLSVLQYAVEVLKVEDIIVCGHYGCGGVNAAIKGDQLGLIDSWLAHIKSAHQYYAWELDSISDPKQKSNKLVELNVLEQLHNLGKTRILRDAWAKHEGPSLHGWVYDIETGSINALIRDIHNDEDLKGACKFERKKKFDSQVTR